MIENLVIVESPAKAKTIERFLGNNYIVKSSFGHIRDLEKKDLGIDIENNFQPKYEISADKKAIVKELKQLAKEAKTVWLASDEDREGEAIAWHLFEVLDLKSENTKRIVFHEITKDAILHAIENPRNIDKNLVDAQQARRVLDRLVGFEVSPVLWKKVKPSLSAGRVQSVAVKLIVEREREINHFTEQKYYKVSGQFNTKDAEGKQISLKAELSERFSTEEATLRFLEACKVSDFTVGEVETKPTTRKPAPPFTTSTLQQEASRKLGFSVSQTMAVAQKLYEHGHITYMRTDSVNLSQLAISSAKSVIISSLGEKYSKPRNYATKTKGAQEAHEAIRPTYIDKEEIDGDRNEKQLYTLIRKRMLASQMADAELEKTTIPIHSSSLPQIFTATGEVIQFDGFLKVYMESQDDEKEDEKNDLLPPLHKGDRLERTKIEAIEQYTMHPPRYTEASLVKKMETLGIGRPSTYAPTITTIQNRGYIIKESREGIERQIQNFELKGNDIKKYTLTRLFGSEKKKLFPSDIGMVVTDFLSNYFTNIMDYNFTAKAEEALDHIAEGEVEWQSMIGTFYTPFHTNVEKTLKESERNTGARTLGTDPQTGENVSVRIGRFGPVAQIGEGEHVRYASLLKGQLMETITLEEALALFKFPRILGTYEEKTVSVAMGRFGPYIKHDQLFVSLKKSIDDPGTITLETAIERINEKREVEKNRQINVFENGVQILNGRFGPYIAYNKINYKIPKGKDAALLTQEECMEIIEKSGDSKKKTTKKATTKTNSKAAAKTTKKATKKKE
ncbi:type I DNA topoisomerase [Gabonibacter chumensis]|uniref:type I DNA topoisomerase n=1 Tax=Gabonibacter chumensis TaxID=2972474 RepID=UPI002572FB40|nr:type I DNA topoisomerase [Gabonibacter chumensis]MCR9011337.1 type I DNA topoisomerase [Gabonibacter chumensis]